MWNGLFVYPGSLRLMGLSSRRFRRSTKHVQAGRLKHKITHERKMKCTTRRKQTRPSWTCKLVWLVCGCTSALAWVPVSPAARLSDPMQIKSHVLEAHFLSNVGDSGGLLTSSMASLEPTISCDAFTTITSSTDATTVMDTLSPVVIVIVALGLGVAAQGFINQMLKGDQGLGAFLKDGSGYNRSGFRPSSSSADDGPSDPLPWLKLPQLDFVEVAGQPPTVPDKVLYERLETLRTELNTRLEQGETEEAFKIQEELQGLMEEAGIEYSAD